MKSLQEPRERLLSSNQKKKMIDMTSVFLFSSVLIVILIVAYTAYGLYVKNNNKIAVIFVQQVESPYLDLAKSNSNIDGQALGSALGEAIHNISNDLSRHGYIVMNGDTLLAVDGANNITPIVSEDVANILASKNPLWILPADQSKTAKSSS